MNMFMFLFLLRREAKHIYVILGDSGPDLYDCNWFCGLHILCVLMFFACLSGGDGSSEVLAKDSQSKGSDVSERAGRDSGRHRALRVCQSDGAALQTAGQMRLQSTFPGLIK